MILLRIMLAVPDRGMEELLTELLVTFAVQDGVEVDVVRAGMDYDCIERQILKNDMAILDINFLKDNQKKLFALYQKNPACIAIAVGGTEERLCRYLDIRPGGHLKIEKNSSAPEEEKKLFRLCRQCADYVRESDEIFQFTTKKGIFSITINTILYCQSDLKYIWIVTMDGTRFRKLGKLDELSQKFTAGFLRVHKSFLVNLKHVKGIDKSNRELILEKDIRVPFSSAYQKEVLQIFQK